jgi:hypothetical protein
MRLPKAITLGVLTILALPAIVAGAVLFLYKAGFLTGKEMMQELAEWIERR